MEQNQSSTVGGTKCRPDITVLDTHRQPMAFIEIVRSSRPSNSIQVAEELNIPLFTILAPHRRSLLPGLQPSRPWWDFDPTLPTDAKQQMYFMEQVADELMRRRGEGDSTWANLDMMLDDDGNLAFASFRGSPPDLAGPMFPRTGDLILAELCSWGCDKAMDVLERERLMDQQNAIFSMRQTSGAGPGEDFAQSRKGRERWNGAVRRSGWIRGGSRGDESEASQPPSQARRPHDPELAGSACRRSRQGSKPPQTTHHYFRPELEQDRNGGGD